MKTAKIFSNGNSQAVRLPREFRFAEKDVYITKLENIVILAPKKSPWQPLLASLDTFTDDFLSDRHQPTASDTRSSFA